MIGKLNKLQVGVREMLGERVWGGQRSKATHNNQLESKLKKMQVW